MRFTFTNYVKVLHSISVGVKSVVEVGGDPGNGSYEWVYRDAEGKIHHSDCGYGSPEIALRDGLIAAVGMPDPAVNKPDRQPRCCGAVTSFGPQSGSLMIGFNDAGEVVINFDHDQTGHIVFTQEEARSLSDLLRTKVVEAAQHVAELHGPRITADEWRDYVQYLVAHGLSDVDAQRLVNDSGYPSAFEPWFHACDRAAAEIGCHPQEACEEVPSPDGSIVYLLNCLRNALFDGGLPELELNVDNIRKLATVVHKLFVWSNGRPVDRQNDREAALLAALDDLKTGAREES